MWGHRTKSVLGMPVSQGLGAPSFAELGPKGVVLLVVAGPARSQGFAGAGLPVGTPEALEPHAC